MICPRCQSDNPPQAQFCPNCGARFEGDWNASATTPPRYTGPLRKGLAISSLILGILSLATCSLFAIGGVVGLVLGIAALVKASNKPQEYGGRGMAITGIAASALSFFLGIFVAAIAVPNLLRSQQAAREAAAIAEIRTIAKSESIYYIKYGEYGSLEQLCEKVIDCSLTQDTHAGYHFRVRLKNDSFEAVAVPTTHGTFGTGTRSFYTSPDMVIRSSVGSREATASDPPIHD